jgi:flavin-dependent dehydrogenase
MGAIAEGKPKFVGFKAHFSGVEMPGGVCEIYAFRGGYAGLSFVENGEANLCFLARASLLSNDADADDIFNELRTQHRRAGRTLASAKKIHEWLAVAVSAFGFNPHPPVSGLYTIGDSAAFVDPFTGSGMLMAMESASILSGCIAEKGLDNDVLAPLYNARHHAYFRRRLRVSRLIRQVAYTPSLGKAAVRLLSASERLRLALARKTRSAGPLGQS